METVPFTKNKRGARKKGKKNRKWGRYSRHPSSVNYRNEKRWIKNREKRILRHLKNYPNDRQAQAALDRDVAA